MRTPLEAIVINLRRSVDRRKAMQQSLDTLGLPYRFFEAIDGRGAPHPLFSRYDERMALVRRGIPLSVGELGCFASHYLVWEHCLTEGRPLLICEDDIAFGPRFKEAWIIAARKIDNYELLRFSAHKNRRYVVCETVAEGMDIVRFERPPLGASCYSITPDAARSLLNHSHHWFEPVDLHLDRFWQHGVPSRGFMPPPVIHAAEQDEQSDIRRDALPKAKDRRYRWRRFLHKMRDELLALRKNVWDIGRWKHR